MWNSFESICIIEVCSGVELDTELAYSLQNIESMADLLYLIK